MKHLILFTVILMLLGCDKISGESQDGDRVASKNATSYLDKPPTGKIIQHGLYKLLRSGGVVDDPDTNTGKVTAKPVLQQVNSSAGIFNINTLFFNSSTNQCSIIKALYL